MSEREPAADARPGQSEALLRLVAAAECGNGSAACRLGDMYLEGLGGLRHSPRQAFRWYARSAMAGDAHGQNNVGACYEHGVGCKQSYASAARYYRLAAGQDLSTAAMNLGYCYLHGHGIARHEELALRWFKTAVELGEERAAAEIERLQGQNGPRSS